LVHCCWHAPVSCAGACLVAPPGLRLGTTAPLPLCPSRRARCVSSVLHTWRGHLLRRPCTWAIPPRTAQDAPRVEVDLIHDAAAVRRGRDAKDALRALVLHETQGIVGRVRIEELVALLGDVGEVMVLDQEHERLVEEDIHLVGVEDVLGLQYVTEG